MREQRGMPVFVKVDQYKEILDVLEMLKGKMNEIHETLAGINKLREEEDAEIMMWNSTISGIEKKIDNMDKTLFEPEHAW